MNLKQKIVLLIAITLLVIFAISDFEKIGTGGSIISNIPSGRLIISILYLDVVLSFNYLALLIQWAIIVAIYGMALWIARSPKKNS
jgi:hypothetical protein